LALDQLRAADAARGLETVIVPLDDPETGRYAALHHAWAESLI